MTDEQILVLYQNRAQTAISITEEQYGSYCRTIARNILCSHEDAEECVNDTWLTAWNTIPPQRPQRLSAYLGKITRNLALDRLRHDSAEKRGGGQVSLALAELDDCIPAPRGTEQAIEALALTQTLETFLLAQPAEKRRVFLQRYWYLYPIRDIAATHKTRESKIVSMLFRMRQDLKKYLEQEGISL